MFARMISAFRSKTEQTKIYIRTHRLSLMPAALALLLIILAAVYISGLGSGPLPALFCALTVAVLLVPRGNAVLQFLHLLAWAALPCFVFLEFEILSGNLQTIESSYISYSCLLLYLLLLILSVLFTFRIGAVILALAGNLFSLANYFVLSFRGTPISLSDLLSIKTAATVAGNYSYQIPSSYISLVFATAALICLFVCANPCKRLAEAIRIRYVQGKLSIRPLAAVLIRAFVRAFGALAFIFLLISFFFRLPTQDYYTWEPTLNYSSMGWVYTICMQLRETMLDTPEGYSAQQAETLLSQTEPARSLGNIQPDKLIIIMNESFSDLAVLGDFNVSSDYMPFFHSLENGSRIEKGYLSVPVLGGGTCNTEWEVLSGNNKVLTYSNFAPYDAFYSLENQLYNTDSLASAAAEEGYYSAAMHPYDPENWNRDVVYQLMGFQDFLSLDDFTDYPMIRCFVSDAGNYQKIIDYDNASGKEKLFIFNVTIQNHGGYDYEENLYYENKIFLTDIDDAQANNYLSLIYESDQAFQSLIEYYDSCGENVMIVMFGDHQPYMTTAFYKNIYDNSIPSEDAGNELRYLTPYVIWSNYDRNTREDISLMSSSFFGAYIKQAAGWTLDSYDSYLLSFMESIPSVGHYGIFDSSQQYTSYSALSEQQSALLEQLRIVQYYHMKN